MTANGPDVAPDGTRATTRLLLQLVVVTAVPFSETVPVVVPKLAPSMRTAVPTGPLRGDIPEIPGALVTVKLAALLATPETVTKTFPEDALEGTCATIPAAVQVEGAVATPLKVRELDPCVAPKFSPKTVTSVLCGPEDGDKLEIVGLAVPPEPVVSTAPTE